MRVSSDEGGWGLERVVGMADVGMLGSWNVGQVGWRWIYRKTGGVAEMKDNDVKGGRRVVWSPQERQAEFMQRGEYEALYGGAAGGGKSDALFSGGAQAGG